MRVTLLFSLLLCAAAPVFAQVKPPAKMPGNFTFSASKNSFDEKAVRFYGSTSKPARIDSEQLSLVAPTIVIDLENNKPVRVRALGGVSLKANLTSTTPGAPITHIESVSEEAVLTIATRTLVLTKNLNGFYQVGTGAKNTLSGDAATLNYQNSELLADIVGGQRGVKVTVPAETLGRPDDLGVVTITSQNAKINQKTGIATFTGNAHAVATGPNGFDVVADEFVLTRNATDNTISTLTTRGRTTVKLDLPEGAAPTTTVAATGSKTPASIGRPTHVEVTSDSAIIERATSTATFNGNVKGFYRLKAPTGAEQNYNFTGDQAIVRYDPTKGNAQNPLSVEISNAQIDAPGFDLGL